MYSKVKELCKKHNISVSELENKLGFSRGSICKWSIHTPGINKVKAVADFFGVALSYFNVGCEFSLKNVPTNILLEEIERRINE